MKCKNLRLAEELAVSHLVHSKDGSRFPITTTSGRKYSVTRDRNAEHHTYPGYRFNFLGMYATAQ